MAAKHIGILVGVLLVLIMVFVFLLWKPMLPVPPGPQPPPPFPLSQAKLKTAEGIVSGYGSNAHQDINSIQIQSKEAGLLSIDFLPHTAKAVMELGQTGASVSVKYILQPSDEAAGYRLREIKNNTTGVNARLNELPPPPDVPSHNVENFNLAHPLLIVDGYGGIVALRSGDSLFHFKPGLVDDILPLIKNTKIFSLMAVKRDDNLGFVNIHHDKVYIVLNITIDNKTFLVR